MLGAIIGDLAGDLWQRDRTMFYRQLVDEKAQLSIYGLTVLKLAPYIICHREVTRNLLSEMGLKAQDDDYLQSLSQQALVLFGMCGWTNLSPDSAFEQANQIRVALGLEKEEWYACNLLSRLICLLRQGHSKKEALNGIDELFRKTMLSWDKSREGVLGAIARAWDAFYRAFDFTSTIHSAVKSQVNPRLTTAVAGLLGEAMYSCEQGMLKKKYSESPAFRIELPEGINCSEIIDYKESVRMFYPKNRAMSNVERHHWTTIANPYEGLVFGKDLYQKICMALDTSFDNRYGIYLDDGWFYVYRSNCLLNRFKIKEIDGKGYCITDLQNSDDVHVYSESYHAMSEAFYSIENPPYRKETVKPILVINELKNSKI